MDIDTDIYKYINIYMFYSYREICRNLVSLFFLVEILKKNTLKLNLNVNNNEIIIMYFEYTLNYNLCKIF